MDPSSEDFQTKLIDAVWSRTQGEAMRPFLEPDVIEETFNRLQILRETAQTSAEIARSEGDKEKLRAASSFRNKMVEALRRYKPVLVEERRKRNNPVFPYRRWTLQFKDLLEESQGYLPTELRQEVQAALTEFDNRWGDRAD